MTGKHNTASTAAVDIAILREITDGDAALEKKLVGIFAGQSERTLAALHGSCERDDAQAWRNAAHMFKGSAGAVGAAALSLLCHAGQSLGDTAERAAMLEKITAEYARVTAYFRGIGLLE